MQYFRRKENIALILTALRRTSDAAEAPVELMVELALPLIPLLPHALRFRRFHPPILLTDPENPR
jgi:hypothetical protein